MKGFLRRWVGGLELFLVSVEFLVEGGDFIVDVHSSLAEVARCLVKRRSWLGVGLFLFSEYSFHGFCSNGGWVGEWVGVGVGLWCARIWVEKGRDRICLS